MPKQEAKVITADSPQIVQQFVPTLGMQKWLDTAIEMTTDSPTHIGSESGLSKTNWYEWLKVPGFEDWYYEAYRNKRKRWLPSLDAIGMKHAKAGKYDFWKDMNKKAGDILDDGVKTSVNVQVLNQIKKDKEEFDL